MNKFLKKMEKYTLKQIIEVYLLIVLKACHNMECILQKLNLNLHDEDDEDNILTEYEKNFLIKVPVFIEWKPNFIKLINNILNQHERKKQIHSYARVLFYHLLLFMINISTYDKHPCNI